MMRIIRVALAGSMALLAGVEGAAATAPAEAPVVKQRRVSAAPLRPLSDRDQGAARGSGCQLSFNTARSTLVYVIGNELMIRTRSGRAVCPINDRQFSALSNGGTRSCGGVRVTVRRTGRSVGNEASDSSSAPAVLTVVGGGRTWSTRGHWGTAC